MHYLIQTTLEELEAACREVFDEVQWVPLWKHHGGTKYVGHYTHGQAVISGPITIGNPNKQWFEIQCENDDILTDISADETHLMRDKMRSSGLMRAAYRVANRRLILNSGGQPVGPMPDFVLAGTNPRTSYLVDEELEEAEVLLDMEG